VNEEEWRMRGIQNESAISPLSCEENSPLYKKELCVSLWRKVKPRVHVMPKREFKKKIFSAEDESSLV